MLALSVCLFVCLFVLNSSNPESPSLNFFFPERWPQASRACPSTGRSFATSRSRLNYYWHLFRFHSNEFDESEITWIPLNSHAHWHPPLFRARTRQDWFCQTYPFAHTWNGRWCPYQVSAFSAFTCIHKPPPRYDGPNPFCFGVFALLMCLFCPSIFFSLSWFLPIRLAIKGVRKQFVILDQNRVSFVHLRVFTTENEISVFKVYFLDRQLVHSLKESARLVSCLLFVENKAHRHMLCVYGLKCWRRSPAALSLNHLNQYSIEIFLRIMRGQTKDFLWNNSSPRIHLFIFTLLFSPTRFHPPVFTDLFPPTFFDLQSGWREIVTPWALAKLKCVFTHRGWKWHLHPFWGENANFTNEVGENSEGVFVDGMPLTSNESCGHTRLLPTNLVAKHVQKLGIRTAQRNFDCKYQTHAQT